MGYSFAGPGFQGIDYSVGGAKTKYKLPSAEVYNAGVDQAYSTLDTNQNKSGATVGVSYGLASRNFVTTFGIDYINATPSMSTTFKGTSTSTTGPITQVLQNRYELYIAPGYKITPSTLAYLKLGVVDIPTKPQIDTSSVATLTGGPSSYGAVVGLGMKQKFSYSSPYFLKFEYTGGQTKKAQTLDSTGNQYQSKLMYQSASASIGVNF